jgi:hypothetical protein
LGRQFPAPSRQLVDALLRRLSPLMSVLPAALTTLGGVLAHLVSVVTARRG